MNPRLIKSKEKELTCLCLNEKSDETNPLKDKEQKKYGEL